MGHIRNEGLNFLKHDMEEKVLPKVKKGIEEAREALNTPVAKSTDPEDVVHKLAQISRAISSLYFAEVNLNDYQCKEEFYEFKKQREGKRKAPVSKRKSIKPPYTRIGIGAILWKSWDRPGCRVHPGKSVVLGHTPILKSPKEIDEAIAWLTKAKAWMESQSE